MNTSNIIVFSILLCLLSACSGLKPYLSASVKNLRIESAVESGALFSKVQVSIDIYQVTRCQHNYQGTVKLDKKTVEVGLPANQLSYLVINFSSGGFLSSVDSSMNYDVLLQPKTGYKYEAKVSYVDDIYEVVIYETHTRKKIRREIESTSLTRCKN